MELRPDLHDDAKVQFERLLRRCRVNRLADRMKVVNAFLSRDAHHSAEQWQGVLQEQGDDLNLEFVRETLDKLAELGVCTRTDIEGAPPAYEHTHLGEHHDHLICTQCGSINEFERPRLEELKHEVAREHGFHHLRHKLNIYGICSTCLATRRPGVPLSLASVGERVRVERIAGGTNLTNRLQAMGITVGTELEVISGGGGLMVVACHSTRTALGREVSSKIHVAQA